MARARNIKPGFFRNADLVELSFEARLLFIGLWTIADREGRLEDRPKQIKMELFPADNLDCELILNSLAEIGMIERYLHDGKRYLQVINFSKHQNPHKDERVSTIPSNGEHDASTVQTPCNINATSEVVGLIPDSLLLIPEEKTLVVVTTSPSSKTEDGFPDCPHQKILSAYKQALPELPYPKDWSGSRASALKSRWVWVLKSDSISEKSEACGIDYFKRMFEYIAQSDFLTGRAGKFSASLDWICKNENFLKIIEGKYENRKEAA